MLVFGITGGSGSGKSSASERFRENGIYVIDADKTAREVVRQGEPCLEELVKEFGSEILNDDGSLNRRKTGEIVFSDKKKLDILNRVTHKYIQKALEDQLNKIDTDIAAVDGAVIIGSPVEKMCSFLVSVMADKEIRVKRIMARDDISREAALKRIESQPSDEFYIANSRYLLYNNISKENLNIEVDKLAKTIKESMR
jgi:dephospho-CoA kinase